jgi:hypothetical protein
MSLQAQWQTVTNSGAILFYLAIFAKFMMKKFSKNVHQTNGGKNYGLLKKPKLTSN